MSLFEARENFRQGKIGKPEYIDCMQGHHAQLLEYSRFIKDTDICSIDIRDGLVIMTCRSSQVKMGCPINDRRTAPFEILNFGSYEKAELGMALKLIEPDQTVVDVGANVGWFSLNIAKRYPHSQILAFEPVPNTFDLLKKNIKLNGMDSIQTFRLALSSQNGEAILYMKAEDSANASTINLNVGQEVQKATCTMRQLDELVKENGWKVDFIKCDVEGGELMVLDGALDSIDRFKPIIWAEMLRKWSACFGYHPNQIIEMLNELGYRCFTVNGANLQEFCHMDEDTLETNFFFLNRIKHASKIRSLVGP